MILTNLRNTRISQGRTQTFMARKLGYKSVSGYANIEMGRTKVSLEKAQQIAEILDANVNELFFEQNLHKLSKKAN